MSLTIDLHNKTALITGATGQLGRSLVKTLASCGANIIIHYKNNATKAEELRQAVESQGGKALAIAADVTNEADVSRMKNEIAQSIGMPDIIVTNAVSQVDPWQTILNEPIDKYTDQFKTCIMHNVLIIKAFVPAMIAKKYGRIIGINTECSMQLHKTQSAYAAAKRGMDGVLRVLAKEVGPHQITVNQIAPGWIITENERNIEDRDDEEYIKQIPLQRRGTDQEVCNVVAFLASDLSSFITGAFIPVSGGSVMPCI